MAPAPSALTWEPNIMQSCSGKMPSPDTRAEEQSRGDLHQCWMESCPLAVQLYKGKCAVQLPKEKRSICWDTRKDIAQ